MKTTIQLFKGLSEEVRLRIIGLLLNGERCVCDLMAVLNLPQSTVSRHLAYLKRAGWIEGERRGAWMFYRLAAGGSALHDRVFAAVRAHLATLPACVADQQALQFYLCSRPPDECC